MRLEGNTIFITGGGTGIGRALAEALHQRGNKIIISGRRKDYLAETVRANPGIESVEMDVTVPASITETARHVIAKYPTVNVIVNNAGIMGIDDVAGAVDESLLLSTVTTNLLGPIRVTGAFLEHLKRQPHATIINVSSVLGFVPLAVSAVYSSTKSAIHSYSQSLRYKLRDTTVKVVELVPPWVQTDLLDSRNEPRAMPLKEFIDETVRVLGTDVEEVLVERARPLRANAGPSEGAFVTQFNDSFAQTA
jgi:uncharacterized oxidoreductase